MILETIRQPLINWDPHLTVPSPTSTTEVWNDGCGWAGNELLVIDGLPLKAFIGTSKQQEYNSPFLL